MKNITILTHRIFVSIFILIAIMVESVIAQTGTDYFPLHVGDYAIQHTDYVGGVWQPTTFRMDIEAIDQIAGENYYRWKQTRRVDDGSDESTWYSWVRSDVSGGVLGAFGYEPSFEEINIQTATITVDGDPGDWLGIDPLVSDPPDDDSPDYTGDDIKALYAAQDAEHLYLRMDLWENVNTNFRNEQPPNDGLYYFLVSSNADFAAMFMGINYENVDSAWRLRNNESMPQGLEGFEYVGVAGSVIELKLPFAMIGTPTAYFDIIGDAVTTAGDEFVALDEVRKTATSIFDPPLPWVPNEMLNVGYTWEFDAPAMGGYYSNLVESTSETVEVPAGVFDNCIRVRMVITDIFEDTTQINTMYFAAGVGQVLNESWNRYYGDQHFALTEYQIANITLQTDSAEPVSGQGLTITVTPSQQMIPIIQKLYYRMGGQEVYQETDLAEAGNAYTAVIPANAVTIRGIEYYVRISDGQADVTFPEQDAAANPVWLPVHVDNHRPRLALQEMKYKMISVPVALNNRTIDAVLLDDYGEYDKQQ